MDILVTRRLSLRPPIAYDADDIALWLANPTVARMLARVPQPYHRRDAADWIGSVRQGDDDVFTIHRERLIGVASIEYGLGHAELGYWLGAPWQGRGFMTEALGALLAHVFEKRDLSEIRSSAFAGNRASLRVQEKLGFAITGTADIWSVPRQAMVGAVTTRLTRAAFFAARSIQAEAA